MNIPYSIEVHDNLLSVEQNNNLYKYVKNLEFTGVWKPTEKVVFNYTLTSPRSPGDWMLYQSMGVRGTMHRTALASDEASLKNLHVPIYLLWKEINRKLNNQFELTGNPEGMVSNIDMPTPQDPNLTPGWRAYINLVYNVQASRGLGYAHRDTPLEYNDPDTVTMLYVVNPEWYPSWGAELKYYPEDQDGSTGDQQQFNLAGEQKRNYNVGWLDQGRVVSPVPGRLIVYDGRCLHGTLPANGPIEIPSIKIAFRARRKRA
jgi:hypothetical protein